MLDIAQSNVPFVVLDVPHIWTSWTEDTAGGRRGGDHGDPGSRQSSEREEYRRQLKRARPNDPPPRLVLNQIGMPKRSEIKPDKFAAALQMEPAACILFDPSTVQRRRQQGADDSRIIRELCDLREKLPPRIAQTITGSARAEQNPPRKSKFVFQRPCGAV